MFLKYLYQTGVLELVFFFNNRETICFDMLAARF